MGVEVGSPFLTIRMGKVKLFKIGATKTLMWASKGPSIDPVQGREAQTLSGVLQHIVGHCACNRHSATWGNWKWMH